MEFSLVHPLSDKVHCTIHRHSDGTIVIRMDQKEFWISKNDVDFREKAIGVLNVLTYPFGVYVLKWRLGMPDGSLFTCPSLVDALMAILTFRS